LHEKERSANIDREQPIEILDRRFLDRRSFRHSRIGDKDIQAIADDVAGELRKLVRSIGRGQIDRDRVSATAGLAYLGDDAVGFGRATAVVDENLGAGGGERECARAPHAARSAGDESGFAGQTRHDHSPCRCCGGELPGRSSMASTRSE
jgi:hypothetical protein